MRHSIQPSVMYTVSLHHVCCGIVCHVNYGSSLRRTWKANEFYFSAGQRTGASCMQQSNCWITKLLTSLNLIMSPLNGVEVNPIDYNISRVMHYHEYMLQVNKIEEIKQ